MTAGKLRWRGTALSVACFVSLFTLCIIITWNRGKTTPTQLRAAVTETRFRPLTLWEPTFIVLVQTESCLTGHMRSEYAFGNTSTCQCDVLVLSFKRECNETLPKHIKYIFKSKTTWNEGRNLLYDVAKSRAKRYLYYIFTDDDINLTTKLKVNPWIKFLEFLQEIEPAVGVIDKPWQVRDAFDAGKRLGCGTNDISSVDFINAPNFDSAFNAFHYKAVDHILPYPTQFDNESWWWSGFYSKIICDVKFPGQTVVLTKINVLNPQHRKYPRKLAYDPKDWSEIMESVESRIPEKYHNSKLVQAWREVGEKNELKSEGYCFPLPKPHMPIKPFFYLESK